MKKDKTILKITVCFMTVIFVFLFGELYIKDACSSLFVIEPGYKNLAQVKVSANDKFGAGVIYDITNEEIVILTSKHVVDETSTPVVTFGDGYSVNANVRYYFKEMDAALIYVEKREGMSEYLYAPERADAVIYDSMELCDEVFYANGMSDKNLTLLKGTLFSQYADIGLEQKVGLLEGEVLSGMSGEGVFDKEGRLLGIIVAADDRYGAFIPSYMMDYELKEKEE